MYACIKDVCFVYMRARVLLLMEGADSVTPDPTYIEDANSCCLFPTTADDMLQILWALPDVLPPACHRALVDDDVLLP